VPLPIVPIIIAGGTALSLAIQAYTDATRPTFNVTVKQPQKESNQFPTWLLIVAVLVVFLMVVL
jgi:CHASE3 domain sensor protein